MFKIIALAFIAVVACTAFGTWAAANSGDHGRPSATWKTPINPLALMKASPSSLQEELFDTH